MGKTKFSFVDKEMTYFAFEVHKKITSEKKSCSSKKYYDIIDLGFTKI